MNDTERAAFEAWLNPGRHAGNVFAWVEPGRYERDTHQLAWLAWKARAEVAPQFVKIPKDLDEAQAMLRVSCLWLQAHAPRVLQAMLRAPAPNTNGTTPASELD